VLPSCVFSDYRARCSFFALKLDLALLFAGSGPCSSSLVQSLQVLQSLHDCYKSYKFANFIACFWRLGALNAFPCEYSSLTRADWPQCANRMEGVRHMDRFLHLYPAQALHCANLIRYAKEVVTLPRVNHF
jgi:hypothetical protein